MSTQEHLCDSCTYIISCPKAKRFKEVEQICERHFDEITDEIQQRPRDTEYMEYTLGINCSAIVVQCPYFKRVTTQLQ